MELDKLAPALVALQADLTPVAKSASNPFFKSSYAPLPEVMEAVQPLLAKHKLAVSQFLTNLDGTSALRTILIHESGQYIEDVQPLLLVKNDPQSQGSATTYARRYGIMSVLGVVADNDDDGHLATQAAAKAQKPAASDPHVPKSSGTSVSYATGSTDDTLARAKRDINEGLEKLGITAVIPKKNFIREVIGQSNIETIAQASDVMDAIELQLEDSKGEQ